VGSSYSAGGLNQINRAKIIEMNLNLNQTHQNFILSKQDLPTIKIFEIKYSCEGFRTTFSIGTSFDSKWNLN
jgi:hypothetical protein